MSYYKYELKNVKIGYKNFRGQTYPNGYNVGKVFYVLVSPKDANELKKLGCSIYETKTGSKYVMVKIPKFQGELIKKIRKMDIRVKIRGNAEINLDYASVGILDSATIQKANITVEVYKSEKFNTTTLFLLSMEAYVNKNMTIPVTDFIPIAVSIRDQAYKDCVDKLKYIVNNLEVD